MSPAVVPSLKPDPDPNRVGQPMPEPLRVTKIRVLGNGRAATAELVEAVWADGSRTRCVEKVFDPGLLTRVIYRIAFAAPFAYRSNRHAILACFYRRRVIASWLKRKNATVRVATPLYVRFDQPRRAWVLAAEWIEGRGPIIKSNHSDEMGALVAQMNQLESGLIDAGLYGSGWQVSPRALVSTANLLIVDRPQLSIFSASDKHPGTEPQTDTSKQDTDTVIIDLESGIPAVLVFRYLALAWKQGSVFPFDDLDEKRLLQTTEAMNLDETDDFQRDVNSLVSHSRAWKDTELALFRKPWRWLSKRRRSLFRQESTNQWARERVVDGNFQSRLQRHPMLWLCFWLVGALPLLGRLSQRLWGSRPFRSQVKKLVADSRYRDSVLRLHRARTTQQWISESRIPRRTKLSSIQFVAHQVISKWMSPGRHRWFSDRKQRKLRRRKSVAMITSRAYQSKIARRLFNRTVGRWESRRWLDSSVAAQLRGNFDRPDVGIYSRGVAKHLAIKTLSPVVSMFKVTGMAATLAGGSFWYAVVPFLILPFCRSAVTLQSWWASRHTKTPHAQALAIGVIPTLGSLAFVLQMFNSNPTVSEFFLRDAASRIGRHLPIYGGADSRTEHAMLDWVDRGIRLGRKLSPLKASSELAEDAASRKTILSGEEPVQSDRKAA